MRSLHHRIEVLEAQMQMLRDGGETPRGDHPPEEYLAALEQTTPGERERIEEARAAHAGGRGPPEWAGDGQEGGQP